MKSILKFLVEFYLALKSRKTLGSTFKCRLCFIRCDYELQQRIHQILTKY